MMLPVKIFLLSLLGILIPKVWSYSEPVYDDAREPVIFLEVRNLEPKREYFTVGNYVVPASNGFVHLECDVMLESLISVPYGFLKNATLTWELPNHNILKENRAHDSYSVQRYRKSSARLVITDMQPEDVGDYTCRLNLDGEPTQYSRTMYIPELDGTPLLSCELQCTRNQDDHCQLMEYFNIRCQAYGFPQPQINCIFDECETEDTCPPPEERRPIPMYGFGHGRAIYVYTNGLQADDLALRSGRYICEGITHKSISSVTMFVPVSYGVEKNVEPFGPPPGSAPPPRTPEPAFLGKMSSVYYSIGDEVRMTCWTNFPDATPILWTFRNASSRYTVKILTSTSNPDFRFNTDDHVSGGKLSELVVRFAKLEHGGFYGCSANRLSDGTRLSREFVMETYKWADDADMNEDRHVTKRIGGSVTMKCTIITTQADPQIRWLKDGMFLYSSPTTRYTPGFQMVTLTNLVPSDSGVYTCTSRGRFNLVSEDLEGRTTLTVID